MSINIGPPTVDELKPRIAVIGVGGAGGNAIANMIAANVEGVDFIVANTDAQALNSSATEQRIQLGPEITQGLGAGSRPEVGRAAAEETIAEIEQALEGAHMCFVAAGMGGGTGTGAAPVIAKIAREKNILTVGVVTKPFTFEGSRRMRAADSGIEQLQENVDTLIVIPNQNLFLVANPNTTFKEAFQLADEVLQQGVRSITDLMVMPGLINLDFADVRSVMSEMGKAMMGTGEADGDNRALEAAERAIANPLLDGVSMQGAKGVIISITGGEDMRLMEVDEAANHIRELVDADANIIWGSAFNDGLEGKIRVSVVATGIDAKGVGAEPSRSFSLSSVGTPQPVAPVEPVEEEGAKEEIQAGLAEDEIEAGVADPQIASEPVASDVLDLDMPKEYSEDPVGDTDGEFADDDLGSNEPAKPQAYGEDATPEPVVEQTPVYGDDEPDELVLDDSDMVDTQAAIEDTQVSDEPAPPRVASGGGTLFERMANLSRNGAKGGDKSEDDDDDGPLNIPRFLNRQNNQ